MHPDFPVSPHAILDPKVRWFPADEALRESSMEKLMPPLVPQLRRKVQEWRASGYVGAAPTSKSRILAGGTCLCQPLGVNLSTAIGRSARGLTERRI